MSIWGKVLLGIFVVMVLVCPDVVFCDRSKENNRCALIELIDKLNLKQTNPKEAEKALKRLTYLTEKNFGYDVGLWLSWYNYEPQKDDFEDYSYDKTKDIVESSLLFRDDFKSLIVKQLGPISIDKTIFIEVKKGGAIMVDSDLVVNSQELRKKIKMASKDKNIVVIIGDPFVEHKYIINVLGACGKVGVFDIKFLNTEVVKSGQASSSQ